MAITWDKANQLAVSNESRINQSHINEIDKRIEKLARDGKYKLYVYVSDGNIFDRIIMHFIRKDNVLFLVIDKDVDKMHYIKKIYNFYKNYPRSFYCDYVTLGDAPHDPVDGVLISWEYKGR